MQILYKKQLSIAFAILIILHSIACFQTSKVEFVQDNFGYSSDFCIENQKCALKNADIYSSGILELKEENIEEEAACRLQISRTLFHILSCYKICQCMNIFLTNIDEVHLADKIYARIVTEYIHKIDGKKHI